MDLRIIPAIVVVLCALGCTGVRPTRGVAEKDVADVTTQTAEANDALVRGDIAKYIKLTKHANDYLLMNPFGGSPRRGFEDSSERRASMAQFFKADKFNQEVVATYASGELIVLVTIERVHGVIGGLPEQDWSLRVTQVFRRDGSDWKIVHRHADPLANSISVEQAAALASGSKR
jgi:ketosteroid isomerase-like protein